MSLDAMNELVADDPLHIPRGPKGSPQNEFRAFYQEQRMHGLSRGEARKDTFLRCLDYWRTREYPDPQVDATYFYTED